MSKSETNPESEIRSTRVSVQSGWREPRRRRSKLRRSCLFIGGSEFPKTTFCFSAARNGSRGANRSASAGRDDSHQFAPARAAEKQKVNCRPAGCGYKQATPTGLEYKSRILYGGRGGFKPIKIVRFGFSLS